MPEPKDVLTILPRPQISVTLTSQLDVEISVIGISENNERIVMNEVVFPVECAREIGQALLKIADGM